VSRFITQIILIVVSRSLIKIEYSTDGNLWVAVYSTGKVMVFNPEGKKLKEVELPAKYPTCPTWGGKNHDILYLSTARDRTENPDPNDDGGHIYMFKPSQTQGQAKYEFAG
jgi:sugar lactone lactonase YvrE